jgi:hypothetical protein
MGKPKWKIFEELVAKVQKDLSPQAIVETNQRIRGKSGSLRQVEGILGDAPHICSLSVRYQSSTYPLPSSLILSSYVEIILPGD